MTQATVQADTPIFCDYQQLDMLYPHAKFIYLTRDFSDWLPSIRQLLSRMLVNLLRDDGGFNPLIKRCYLEIFPELSAENIASDDYLIKCYLAHQNAVEAYFNNRVGDLLTLDVSEKDSFAALLSFLNIDDSVHQNACFEHVNIGGKVTAWNQVKHANKIESTQAGRVDKIWY